MTPNHKIVLACMVLCVWLVWAASAVALTVTHGL